MSLILYADDHAHMRRMVRDLLAASGHEVILAADGAGALACLRGATGDREPELLLLDVTMPGMTGFDVCRAVKDNPLTAHIPVLMLTGESDVTQKVTGFDAGADDYLTKPFDPRELRSRVNALLRLVRREADRNPTSGLPGGQAVERAIAERVAEGRRFAVGYADVDHFKPFNDVFGFVAADRVIRGTGGALRAAVSEAGDADAFAGHVGGDDFVFVTEAARGEAVARECVRRVRAVVEHAVGERVAARGTFAGLDRDGHRREYPLPSVSVAVVVVEPERWDSTVALGARAAELKRLAKQHGGGAVLVDTL